MKHRPIRMIGLHTRYPDQFPVPLVAPQFYLGGMVGVPGRHARSLLWPFTERPMDLGSAEKLRDPRLVLPASQQDDSVGLDIHRRSVGEQRVPSSTTRTGRAATGRVR